MAIYSLTPWMKKIDEGEHDHENFINTAESFIKEGKASIAYWPGEAGAYYQIFQGIEVGDIIYMKVPDWEERSIQINAIGFVTNNDLKQDSIDEMRYNSINVKWFRVDDPITISINDTATERKTGDPYSSRIFGITLYEEFNPYIQERILSAIFKIMEPSV